LLIFSGKWANMICKFYIAILCQDIKGILEKKSQDGILTAKKTDLDIKMMANAD
jgi:hypothetical protein